MFKTNNTTKLAIITFFANLYFYNQIGTLYQQSRGLSLFEVSSITSIIIFTVFIGEVPAGVVADRIGRKWSVVIAMAMQALGEWMYLFAKTIMNLSLSLSLLVWVLLSYLVQMKH